MVLEFLKQFVSFVECNFTKYWFFKYLNIYQEWASYCNRGINCTEETRILHLKKFQTNKRHSWKKKIFMHHTFNTLLCFDGSNTCLRETCMVAVQHSCFVVRSDLKAPLVVGVFFLIGLLKTERFHSSYFQLDCTSRR